MTEERTEGQTVLSLSVQWPWSYKPTEMMMAWRGAKQKEERSCPWSKIECFSSIYVYLCIFVVILFYFVCFGKGCGKKGWTMLRDTSIWTLQLCVNVVDIYIYIYMLICLKPSGSDTLPNIVSEPSWISNFNPGIWVSLSGVRFLL